MGYFPQVASASAQVTEGVLTCDLSLRRNYPSQECLT